MHLSQSQDEGEPVRHEMDKTEGAPAVIDNTKGSGEKTVPPTATLIERGAKGVSIQSPTVIATNVEVKRKYSPWRYSCCWKCSPTNQVSKNRYADRDAERVEKYLQKWAKESRSRKEAGRWIEPSAIAAARKIARPRQGGKS